jgi:myo-inositol-1(or 4)-monophosphatase
MFDLLQIKKTGLDAARKSAEVLLSYFGNLKTYRKKGAIDLVTRADTESEKIIIDTILKAYPDHGIIAEESGKVRPNADHVWIIDPLDGTTNFAHGVPIYATSIAFAVKGEPIFGIVSNPSMNELFIGEKGGGATLNGAPISVSTTEHLLDALLVTGFPYTLKEMLPPLLYKFETMLKNAQGIRRLGAAALDLCYVACGRFDGFWEQELKPWDTAAGALIANEAGGAVTDFSNNRFRTDMKEILVTNGKIHNQMISLFASGGER